MGQELVIPDSFKGKQMAQAFRDALNPQDDNLSEGIGQSYGVIGYRGKVWSLRYRGERKTIIRPDDGTPSGHLDVIVLGQAKSKSKSFYPDYKDDSSDRPTCASIDGVVPDMDVRERQSTSCALCPRNVWKTDPQTGRKGRDCTDYKRLAVLILPSQTKPVLGTPLLEPVFLRVPPDSLNSLAIMGETMSAQGYHPSSYITRITFDPLKSHPCMVFRPLQGLSEQEAPVVLELRQNPTVGRITGGDVASAGLRAVSQALSSPGTVATGLGAPATQQGQVVVPLRPATQQPLQQVQQVAQAPISSGVGTGLVDGGSSQGGVVQLATPPQNTSAPHTAALGLLDTGFGGVNTASDKPILLPPGLQTAADAGSPEDSDSELDARIANLINRQ